MSLTGPMTVSVYLVARTGWLILVGYIALTSIGVLATGFYRLLRQDPDRLSSRSFLEQFRYINGAIAHGMFDRILGTRIRDQLLRICLLNYVVFAPLAMVVVRFPGWHIDDSLPVFFGLHFWMWCSIGANFVSLRVTRKVLSKYSAPECTFSDIFKYFLLDVLVVICCLYFTVIAGNISFILQHRQAFSALLIQFPHIFGYMVLSETYVFILEGQGAYPWYWAWVPVFTSILPTLAYLLITALSLLLRALSLPVMLHQRAIRASMIAWIVVLVACLAILITSF
ncbi:hypothetical protein ACFL6M_07805 [Candidatus Eisenbacteria bacterium]|uniref:Uncharacterized protein n=1 Tax=Eiseniibacteriota bacterium TaxID=2212470 RepID=A0ABV6YME5_UNCEI